MIKFNLEELRRILISIYRLSHIKVSIFDDEMNEILYYPSRFLPYCSLIRCYKEGNDVCINSDKEQLKNTKKSNNPISFVCPHGLIEHFAPININGLTVGYLTLGQVFEEKTTSEEAYEKVKRYGITKEESDEAFNNTPHLNSEIIDAVNLIVNACAKYAHLENFIEVSPNDISANIVNYINDNINEKITVEKLCKIFYISRVSLYNLFEKKFGSSVGDYILKAKLNKAVELLVDSNEYRVYEVADAIGEDPNYFTKIFKKIYGISPKQYQKVNMNKVQQNLIKDGGGVIN